MEATWAKLRELATRKFGPLPGWAWGLLGAGTIGVTIYLSRSGAFSSLTGGAATPQSPQVGGGGGAGGGSGGTLAGFGDITPPVSQTAQAPQVVTTTQTTTQGGSPLIQGGQQDGGAGGNVAPVAPVGGWVQNAAGGYWNPNPDTATGRAITAGGPDQTLQQQQQALANYDAQLSAQLAQQYAAAHAPTPGGETSGAGPVGQDVNAYNTPPPPDERQQAEAQLRSAGSGLANSIPSSTAALNDTSGQSRRRGGPQVM